MRLGFSARWLGGVACTGLAAALLTGCGGGGAGDLWNLVGSAFDNTRQTADPTGPGGSSSTTGTGSGSGSSLVALPCEETQARKFVTISMRNLSPDIVHYFMVLIARVDDTTTADIEGSVCPDDVSLYTAFGYTLIPAGTSRPFGNYCIEGPALYYFHRAGQFQTAGTSGLASAIAPAQGSSPSYDSFFGTTGRRVPVPDFILFHNPGTSSVAQALKFAPSRSNPCNPNTVEIVAADCEQDAFYYVDENDRRAGPALPPDTPSGSSVRYPSQVQGSGCQCGLSNEPWATLAFGPSRACDEFFRGGRIDYAFVRDDTEPPYPQLVWRVTDSSNTIIHNFDPRARVP